MNTEITNKRTVIHITTQAEENALRLSGNATLNEEGTVLNFSGSFCHADEEDRPQGSFHYTSTGEHISYNLDIAVACEEEANRLAEHTLAEIRKQNK